MKILTWIPTLGGSIGITSTLRVFDYQSNILSRIALFWWTTLGFSYLSTYSYTPFDPNRIFFPFFFSFNYFHEFFRYKKVPLEMTFIEPVNDCCKMFKIIYIYICTFVYIEWDKKSGVKYQSSKINEYFSRIVKTYHFTFQFSLFAKSLQIS